MLRSLGCRSLKVNGLSLEGEALQIRDYVLSKDEEFMSFIDTRLDTYFQIHPECEACEYRNRCAGGCRGKAAGFGDLMAKDETACAFYRNGWYDRVKKLIKN